MTIDDKKRWLGRYRESNRCINALGSELQQWHARAESVTKPLSDMPRGGSGKNPLEDAMGHVWEIGEQINSEIVRAQQIRREITAAIDQMDNGTYRTLLRLRYISLKKWEWIAVDMDYDYRWVLHLHNKALKNLNTPLKDT